MTLKPCPFCGREAGGCSYIYGWRVNCISCSARVEAESQSLAEHLWNRRATSPEAERLSHAEVLAAVREAGI